jgi:hypothetical protein
MKFKINLALLALLPLGLFGQNQVQQKYAETITADELKQHLYIIASDEFEGRETGKEGQKKAEVYIENEFRTLGLDAPVKGNPVQPESLDDAPVYYNKLRAVEGSHLQPVNLVTSDNLGSELKVAGQTWKFLSDFYFFPGETKSFTNAEEHVFIGYGIEDEKYSDYTGMDVTNKIVWMLSGEPTTENGSSLISGSALMSEWTTDFRKKRDYAISKGAKGIIIINLDYKMYMSRVRYYLESPSMKLDINAVDNRDAKTPTYYVSPELANAVLAKTKLKSIEKVVNRIRKKKKSQSQVIETILEVNVKNNVNKVQSSNVLGYLEGTDLKDEVLVITAHYDHVGKNGEDIYNGADDDGSGTVAVLELAEAFKMAANDGFKPRRSILFMTVTGEEKGLLGSEWYTEFPVFPLKNTVANLNIDMIGRIDEAHEGNDRYVYLIGSDKLSTDLHELSEQANATYTKLALDYTYNSPTDPNRFYYRSDHYNFAKNQIPVIFYFSGVHEDYHQPTDTPEKILYPKLAEITKLIFHTAWEISNRDERLPVNVENEFDSIRE